MFGVLYIDELFIQYPKLLAKIAWKTARHLYSSDELVLTDQEFITKGQ